MVKISYLSVVRFSGVDAGDFLHSQLSADVLALNDSESTFACYCEPKGRVLGLMLVHRSNNEYYVILAARLAAAITDRLKIFIMRSKVSIEVLSDYSVAGLEADDAQALSPGADLVVEQADSQYRLLITNRDITTVADKAFQSGWKISELGLGISWLKEETSAQFLPQMLGYEELGAVNYRKGCYPGQEIVARTHYLGKVKRHPRLLECPLTMRPKPMDKVELLGDDESFDAIVVDSVRDSDGVICLLVVTRMAPELTARQLTYLEEASNIL